MVTHLLRRHTSRVLVAAALVGAFAFGAVVKLAFAAHYHTAGYCNSPHGLVHGNDTRDGSWHGRVEINTCPNTYKYCAAGHTAYSSPWATDTSYTTTCNAHHYGSSGSSEASAYGYAYYEVVLSGHYHYAH